MAPIVVVDSGPLVAAYNTRDTYHEPCKRLFQRRDLEFVVPALCVGEAAFVIGARVDWRAEAGFVRIAGAFDLRLPQSDDWTAIAATIERYNDFDIGVVDASVMVLAERLGTRLIATLDRRHFLAIRPRHVEAFTLLPEL